MKKRIFGIILGGAVLFTTSTSLFVTEAQAQHPDCYSDLNTYNLYLNDSGFCIEFACNCIGLDPVIIGQE